MLQALIELQAASMVRRGAELDEPICLPAAQTL